MHDDTIVEHTPARPVGAQNSGRDYQPPRGYRRDRPTPAVAATAVIPAAAAAAAPAVEDAPLWPNSCDDVAECDAIWAQIHDILLAGGDMTTAALAEQVGQPRKRVSNLLERRRRLGMLYGRAGRWMLPGSSSERVLEELHALKLLTRRQQPSADAITALHAVIDLLTARGYVMLSALMTEFLPIEDPSRKSVP